MSDSDLGDYQFLITAGAEEDLEFCIEEDAWAAAYIGVFLEEVRNDSRYLECMTEVGYHDEQVEKVDGVWSLQQKRINAYLTKFIVIRQWRLIFILCRNTKRIGLFAVMKRSDNYEDNVELWSDIEREFNELGFEKY